MKKMNGLTMAVLLTALLISFFHARQSCSAGTEGDGVYVVKPGDSLSGIAGETLGDVKRWEEILRANPQVTDPTMIFPGDTLAIPGTGQSVEVVPDPPDSLPVEVVEAPPSETIAPEEVTEGQEGTAMDGDTPAPKEEEPPPSPVTFGRYHSAGYIAKELPEAAIISSLKEQVIIGEGHEVLISTPAVEGRVFTVVRPTVEVYHPQSGEYLGWVIKVVGRAVVACAGSETSRAIIDISYQSIQIGDLLVPFDENDTFDGHLPEKPGRCLVEGGGEGIILASQENLIANTEGDIVFLDKGLSDGVTPGAALTVYRQVGEHRELLGQALVLRSQPQTSTVLLTSNEREMAVSERVLLR